MNSCFILYLKRDNLTFYFSTKKRIVENEKKNLFFVNSEFFRNVRECIISCRSLSPFTQHMVLNGILKIDKLRIM